MTTHIERTREMRRNGPVLSHVARLKGLEWKIPALVTRISRWPKWASVACTIFSAESYEPLDILWHVIDRSGHAAQRSPTPATSRQSVLAPPIASRMAATSK
jgi:hypothetical protein